MTDAPATSVGPPAPPATAAPPRVTANTPYRPSSAPVHIGAFTLFACLSLLFASRMAAGEDPALGLQAGALARPAPPGVLQRVVVTRRVGVNGLTRAQIRRRGIRRLIVVRRPVAAPTTVAAVARGTDGGPSPTTAPAMTTPGTTPRSQPTAGRESTGTTTDPAATRQGTTPTAAAPDPVAAAPTAPEPVSAPTPVTPAPAPVPVATTTS